MLIDRFRCHAYAIDLDDSSLWLTVSTSRSERVWTVRFFLSILCYGYPASPPLQLQPHLPRGSRLAKTGCGSGEWGKVVVEVLQSGQLRWWSFVRFTSVCHSREHGDGSSRPSERQITDPWALGDTPGWLSVPQCVCELLLMKLYPMSKG